MYVQILNPKLLLTIGKNTCTAVVLSQPDKHNLQQSLRVYSKCDCYSFRYLQVDLRMPLGPFACSIQTVIVRDWDECGAQARFGVLRRYFIDSSKSLLRVPKKNLSAVGQVLDQFKMEVERNTKYQGLGPFSVGVLTTSPTLFLMQIDFANRLPLQRELHNKKLGFVPFKIPQQPELGPVVEATEGVCSESACSQEDSSSSLDASLGKLVRSKKGPYRRYTLQEKMRAVEVLNSGKDLKSVSKEFDIPRRNLLRWRKNGCQRKEGGGRPTDSAMEDSVCQMLRVGAITTEMGIREAAKKMSGLKNFKASKGWFVKFCRRYSINLQEAGQLDKENL